MTRADRIAAALEHWKKWAEYLRAFSGNTLGRAADAGDALAAILREPQPAPVVGDDDAALLAKTQDWLCHNLTVTPDSHYRNVQALLERCSAALADLARLKEEQDKEAREWNDLRDRYDATVLELTQARAALAAAEQEKEKAVAEEREACAVIAENSGEPFNDEIACATRQTALSVALKIRARAGRGDE